MQAHSKQQKFSQNKIYRDFSNRLIKTVMDQWTKTSWNKFCKVKIVLHRKQLPWAAWEVNRLNNEWMWQEWGWENRL